MFPFPPEVPPGNDETREKRRNPPKLPPEFLAEVRDAAQKAGLRRQRYRTGGIIVCSADGERSEFDMRSTGPAKVTVSCDTPFLDVYGVDEEGEILLAMVPVDGLEIGDSVEVKLEGGQKIVFEVEDMTEGQICLQLEYNDPSSILSKLSQVARTTVDAFREAVANCLNGPLTSRPGLPGLKKGIVAGCALFLAGFSTAHLGISQYSQVSQSAKQDPSADNESPHSRSSEFFTDEFSTEPRLPRRRDVYPIAVYRLQRFSETVRAQVTAGYTNDALRMVTANDQYRDYRDFLLIGVVRMLAEMDNVTKAKEVAATIEDTDGQGKALSHIAAIQASAADFAEALKTAKTIEDAGRQAWTLAGIAKTQAVTGDFKESLEIAKTIADANQQARDWALAEIAEAQAETGDFEDALETTNTIADADRKVWALAEIAETQAEAGDFGGALKTANTIEDNFNRNWTLAEIAETQAEAGDFGGALKTANTIEDNFDQVVTYAEIVKRQAKGSSEDALGTVDEIKNTRGKAMALVEIAVVLAMDNAIEEAMKIAEKIKDEFPQADHDKAFTEIAKARAATGDIESAMETANTIENIYSRAKALAEITVVLAMDNAIDEAMKIAEKIEGESYWVKEAKDKALSAIAKAQAMAKDYNSAEATAKTIKDMVERAGTLGEIDRIKKGAASGI